MSEIAAIPDEAAPYGDVYRFFSRNVSLRSDAPNTFGAYLPIIARNR